MVFSIALLHALPVLAIGMWLKNKELLWGAAVVSGLLALVTGGLRYFGADVVAIGLAVWVVYLHVDGKWSPL